MGDMKEGDDVSHLHWSVYSDYGDGIEAVGSEQKARKKYEQYKALKISATLYQGINIVETYIGSVDLLWSDESKV